MIGSGIFRIPSEIAVRLPGPIPMLAVWVAGGIFALSGALTLCEIAGAYPHSGGLFVFLREAYGRLPAFLFGWANLLLQPASNGAVAIVFSQYALRLAGLDPDGANYPRISAALAVIAIAVVTAANARGVKFGAIIQNLTASAKAGGLLVLILLAFVLRLPSSGSHFTPAVPPDSFSFSLFGLSLISVLFAYDGWMTICFVGGEIANPRRNLPRAILLGVFIVTAIYLLANVAYVAVFSVAEMGRTQTVAADAMARMVGGGGVTFIVATVMLSTFGALNAGMLTAPRIYYAMAEDRLFFQTLARVHPRFRTPHIAVLLSGVMSVCYVLIATMMRGSKAFSALIDACVVGNLPFYALGVGSIFVFRRRERRQAEGDTSSYSPSVRAILYPITPILFVSSTLLLLGNQLLDTRSRAPSLVVLGVLSLGAPLYYATIGRRR